MYPRSRTTLATRHTTTLLKLLNAGAFDEENAKSAGDKGMDGITVETMADLIRLDLGCATPKGAGRTARMAYWLTPEGVHQATAILTGERAARRRAA